MFAADVLRESSAWALDKFFGGVGLIEPDELHNGLPGRTLHLAADAGDTRCRVWLPITDDAAATGLPDIAAHEGFHVAAGVNVYHWTHEALACLAATLSHLRADAGTAPLSRKQLGEALRAKPGCTRDSALQERCASKRCHTASSLT